MNPGATKRPFRSMIRVLLPASFRISPLVPTARILEPLVANASALGRPSTPVQMFPLR